MKHNWEYKRLGSLCEIVRGGSPRPIQDFLTNADNGLNWIKIGDVAVGSKYITSTKEKIKPEGLRKTRQVVKGDFILSNSMSFGRPYILKIDGCIHDGWLAIKGVKNHFLPDFLYYFLSSPTTYSLFEKLVKGGVVSNLNSDIVKGISVPVPPMEVQEQIVAELDKINETIEDCRELLRNLDTLAQSLFYDYFGDPITNPKGWSLYKLSSISQLINGRAYKQNELHDEGKYKVIRVGNFFTNSDYYYSDLELSPEKYIDYGDLIFAWSASFGAFIWQGDKVIYHYHIWKVLFDDNLLNKIFYKFLLNEMSSSFMKDLHGIGMMHLTKVGMENYMLPIPPLALQEKFAARIEQIEEQKKAVEQTIAELQTLLDSRMDYWFN